jgi:hypothetical protein
MSFYFKTRAKTRRKAEELINHDGCLPHSIKSFVMATLREIPPETAVDIEITGHQAYEGQNSGSNANIRVDPIIFSE